MTEKQRATLIAKRDLQNKRVLTDRKYTSEEIVLKVLEDRPDEWFYTWDFAGDTKWGFLSHATHATLRKAEQEGKIIKDYIGKFVVYAHKTKTTLF